MSTTAIVVIIVLAAFVVLLAAAWLVERARRRHQLQETFGPEYDRTVKAAGTRSKRRRTCGSGPNGGTGYRSGRSTRLSGIVTSKIGGRCKRSSLMFRELRSTGRTP